MAQYTIKQAIEYCRYYMKRKIPTFVSGPPGVGKSDLWAQLAKEMGGGFIDLRLGMMDPVDLLGLPHLSGGVTQWARPAYWPDVKTHGAKGIILFDELSDASRAMQSAAYQLVLNGRAGPHVLPEGWYRCAAGNRRIDRAAANSMSTALANRFAHLEVGADVDCFREWCYTQDDISSLLPAFMKLHGRLLHCMEGADLRAFPTPRSWAQVGRILEDAPPSLRFQLVAGLVGDGAAGEVEAFMKTMDLPEPHEILAKPKTCRIPEQPSHKYAVVCMLARLATRSNLDKIGQYIKREQFGRDFEICCMLDASHRDASLTETGAFTEFANRNKDLHL